LKDIYDTALRLLRDLGMGEVPTRLHNDLISAGAVALDNGRVSFPNALVKDAIASAAKTFVLPGRDPDRSIEVGGDRVYFGTGGAAVQLTAPQHAFLLMPLRHGGDGADGRASADALRRCRELVAAREASLEEEV
jgi:trimethylamine:corrinoid methyltransferase-like protein